MSEDKNAGLYLVHLSIHGLVRSTEIEMGANPDTGGQVIYVIDLCKELGTRPNVRRVDLITRSISDECLSTDYAQPSEWISENSRIVRLPFGTSGYLPKEMLWPHLDELVEKCLNYFKNFGRIPDIIHGHYADAGYVGSKLSRKLGVPFVFTGHSLGRSKLRRLFQLGLTEEEADEKYNIWRRIEAEEESLLPASLIVTSTMQEIEEQYFQYRNYACSKHAMYVIPPGVDFSRFKKENVDMNALSKVMKELGRFLRDLGKPIILAIARPDEKKNLLTLVKAFALDNYLRNNSNLVIIAGQRDKLEKLENGPRTVLTNLIKSMDDEDLYGSIALPKVHAQNDIPAYMAVARLTRGVFVNPALTEPFGLTLLEAGAAGLPVVATNDGGPVEIIEKCGHGFLMDPLNASDLSENIKKVIKCSDIWKALSKAALEGIKTHYSWQSHVSKYLSLIVPLVSKSDRTNNIC